MTSTVALFDTIRTVAFGSISGTYAVIGTPLTHMARILILDNNTNGDLYVSTDGINDMIFLAAGSFKLLDLSTNRQNNSPNWVIPIHTQFYVKQITAPSSGSLYLEVVYGKGD